jgi:hypothetical protein
METAIIVAVVLLALAVVLYPLFADKKRVARFATDGEIRQEVDRYRAAIQSKTLCERCLTANPAKSNYCSDCGRAL